MKKSKCLKYFKRRWVLQRFWPLGGMPGQNAGSASKHLHTENTDNGCRPLGYVRGYILIVHLWVNCRHRKTPSPQHYWVRKKDTWGPHWYAGCSFCQSVFVHIITAVLKLDENFATGRKKNIRRGNGQSRMYMFAMCLSGRLWKWFAVMVCYRPQVK